MAEDFQKRRDDSKQSIPTVSSPSPVTEDAGGAAMPPLRFSIDDTDGWITIDEPILYLYAGKGPYVGR